MTREKLRIGLFGYGCVGQGLHDVLNSSSGFKADIVRICVKDRDKKRRIPMSNFTFDKKLMEELCIVFPGQLTDGIGCIQIVADHVLSDR